MQVVNTIKDGEAPFHRGFVCFRLVWLDYLLILSGQCWQLQRTITPKKGTEEYFKKMME